MVFLLSAQKNERDIEPTGKFDQPLCWEFPEVQKLPVVRWLARGSAQAVAQQLSKKGFLTLGLWSRYPANETHVIAIPFIKLDLE